MASQEWYTRRLFLKENKRYLWGRHKLEHCRRLTTFTKVSKDCGFKPIGTLISAERRTPVNIISPFFILSMMNYRDYTEPPGSTSDVNPSERMDERGSLYQSVHSSYKTFYGKTCFCCFTITSRYIEALDYTHST